MNKYYPTINQAFILILLLMALSIPAAIPSIVIKIITDKMEFSKIVVENLDSLGLLIAYIISFLWILKIAINRNFVYNKQKIQWKFQKVPYRLIIIFLIMSLALGILIDPLTELIPMPESFEELFSKMVKPNVFSFLAVVVAAPVLEELFFRGIILEAFLKNYSPVKAIIWSAVIFGSAHFNPWQFVGAGFLGVLIAWAYYKTGSLIPGMLIHFFNNLVGFTVLVASSGKMFSLYELFSSKIIYFLMYGLSALILAVGIFAIKREFMYPVNHKAELPHEINLN